MAVRPPAVAGLFYPSDPTTLRGMVEAMLKQTQVTDASGDAHLRAMIVPHAGYIYSGSTAAAAYAQLKQLADKVRHVVIVGPAHRFGIHGVGLVEADGMATPLGTIPLWQEGLAVAQAQPGVVVSMAAHAKEHSLEVQLPFLQVVLPEADVLPLVAGWVEPEVVANVLEALWDQPEMLVVISSDLSHYHPYTRAQELDSATIDQILELDLNVTHDQACGATGINALLLVAKAHGLKPRMDQYCNSGDTAGDKDGVVGYMACSWFEEVRL